MLIKLIQIELLKTKRSLALLMMFLSPLMVLLINLLQLLHNEGKMIAEHGLSIYWLSNSALWGYFMLPLYIALITALLNGTEHRSNGWRFMMTLPVKQKYLFLAKLILAWIYLIGASLVLFLSTLLSIVCLEAFGISGSDMLSFEVIQNLICSTIACLAILTIQHIVSWRCKNIVAPLGLGVVATMSIVQLSHTKYWHFNPWTYILTSTNSAEPTMQTLAITYSLAITVGLTLIALHWLKRREVTC